MPTWRKAYSGELEDAAEVALWAIPPYARNGLSVADTRSVTILGCHTLSPTPSGVGSWPKSTPLPEKRVCNGAPTAFRKVQPMPRTCTRITVMIFFLPSRLAMLSDWLFNTLMEPTERKMPCSRAYVFSATFNRLKMPWPRHLGRTKEPYCVPSLGWRIHVVPYANSMPLENVIHPNATGSGPP